jgi:hypothetical protein
VISLKIVNSNLQYIQVNAFNSPAFAKTTSLEIDNSSSDESFKFQILSKLAFNGLQSLQKLSITNCGNLEILDQNFLEPFAETLTDLSIFGIANPFSLSKVFGSSKFKLQKIANVNLKNNNLGSINAGSFTGIADRVELLYLMNSKIQTIAANTFVNFGNLTGVSLFSNELTTLPDGVFDNLIKKTKMAISLDDNKWNCNCDFLKVQEMLAENRDIFRGSIKCAAPEELKGRQIVEVELCNEDPVETTLGECSGSKAEEGECEPTDGKIL